MDDAQLRTVWQQRQFDDRIVLLSQPLATFMKHKLAKRFRQLSKLSEVWDEVIPEEINEHTALDGCSRGVLRVLVDSAPHRFQLQALLAGGLDKEIRRRFGGPLNRIRLVPGQFSAIDLAGEVRYQF